MIMLTNVSCSQQNASPRRRELSTAFLPVAPWPHSSRRRLGTRARDKHRGTAHPKYGQVVWKMDGPLAGRVLKYELIVLDLANHPSRVERHW